MVTVFQQRVHLLRCIGDLILDLLRKSIRHTPALTGGARGEHRENELFSKVSVCSVAKQRITYARGQIYFGVNLEDLVHSQILPSPGKG